MQLIGNLTVQVKALSEWVTSPEKGAVLPAPVAQIAAVTGNVKPVRGAEPGRSRPKSLSTVWYECYCDTPWMKTHDTRRYHEVKVTVTFMRLFVPQGCNT
jgi:hypothetical protein